MTLVFKDRVMETSFTKGTGAYQLNGAIPGYQTFVAVGDGNTCYYAATDGIGWEVGEGTYSNTARTLSRDTILASSNAGNAVSWLSTPKSVWVDFPAALASYFSDGTTGTGALVLQESPALTGTPTAPTASVGTSTTQIATTAFVLANVGGVNVADRTALAALSTSKAVAWLEEAGRQGTFQWNSANLSTQVTADTQQGIYVAPSSDPTGASGAWVRQFNGEISPLWFGALGDGTSDDTIAIQASINLLLQVELPKGSFVVDNLTIPALHPGINGAGREATTLLHKSGATSPIIHFDGANRVMMFSLNDIAVRGNLGGSETSGLDLSGFSYCTFENVLVWEFNGDGIYVDGAITPTDKQFSNNTFINVRSIDNIRDGIRLDSSAGAGIENTANTFVGCETSGNTGRGVNELWGSVNKWLGHVAQNNTGRDFYSNGQQGTFDGYTEGNSLPIELGSSSFGHNIRARSSWPLWQTFIDAGVRNLLSICGEAEPERQIFNNPFLARWNLAAPDGITLNGTPTLASVADATSPYGVDVQATVGVNFQGFIFSVTENAAFLAGKWCTLQLEMDTSGVVDPLVQRIYTRDGTTVNGNSGEYASQSIPISAAGQYLTLAYDIRFVPTLSGTPTVIWYMAYSGISAGGNVIKIKSARLIMGRTRYSSDWSGYVDAPISLTTTQIQTAALGVNIALKSAGKQVYDSTNGKLYFAVGTTPTSAWRATDGSGDLTPS